jgi:hypothetical protein
MPENAPEIADFEVVDCHCDHAGKAHLSIRARVGGVEVAIQHLPFEAQPQQTEPEEQAAILAIAARIAHDAADFLLAESGRPRSWPTRARDGEAPSAFGQPIGKS